MIRMNKVILTVIAGLLITGTINAQWTTEKSPVTANLYAIDIMADNTGWIVGEDGTMLYKKNNSWKAKQAITDNNLYAVCFTDASNGWAVGAKGTIIHYDGKNWTLCDSPAKEDLYSVSFRDADNGIAVGSGGAILIYENGMWRKLRKSTLGNFFSVVDRSDISMIAGGMEYYNVPLMKVEHGTDPYLVSEYDPGYMNVKSLTATDKNNIWAVGMFGTIIHFDGSNWEKVSIQETLPTLNSVTFSDAQSGIAVGFNGVVLMYGEQGWQKEVTGENERLNGTDISSDTYYAVGNNGMILSYLKKAAADTPSNNNNGQSKKVESYPNPASQVLNVVIPGTTAIVTSTLSITNSYGQVLFMQTLSPGSAGLTYQVDISGFKSGIYLINISTPGQQDATGKFVVKH